MLNLHRAGPALQAIMCEMTDRERYRTALLDWLACAARGAVEPAARAARGAGDGLLERVAAAATAGHVLDFDDTFAPGIIHGSAPAAPAALVLGSELDVDIATVLDAYAAGFEAGAALARASHPALYDRGWHPTAVCGSVGAAVAAGRLLELDREQLHCAQALALLRAGGYRSAFGSDGKALQVGMATSAGVHAARLAQAGARVPLDSVLDRAAGFVDVFGGEWAEPDPRDPTIRQNWIKAYPCCLGTHSTIEAVLEALACTGPEPGALTVRVHPQERQAAALDDVRNGLEAKFSLPYLAAYTMLHGAPMIDSFAGVQEDARELAARTVRVDTDASLAGWEARIELRGEEVARVDTALGSPERPLDLDGLRAKLAGLVGDRLDGVLDDEAAPAAGLLAAAGLG